MLRELEKNAVKYIEISVVKLCPYLVEQINLISIKSSAVGFAVAVAVKVITIRNFEAAAMPPHRLNGIRTHERFDVAVNRPL